MRMGKNALKAQAGYGWLGLSNSKIHDHSMRVPTYDGVPRSTRQNRGAFSSPAGAWRSAESIRALRGSPRPLGDEVLERCRLVLVAPPECCHPVDELLAVADSGRDVLDREEDLVLDQFLVVNGAVWVEQSLNVVDQSEVDGPLGLVTW